MLNFWQDSREYAKQDVKLENPYNLGPVRNFQVRVVLAVIHFVVRSCAHACLVPKVAALSSTLSFSQVPILELLLVMSSVTAVAAGGI